jgi:hypothetical protein
MSQQKMDFLEHEGLLNPKPQRVIHPLFKTLDFFDPFDLPQVRYEMLRSARGEQTGSVAKACKLFGFSREYFYRLERDFLERGYVSLMGSPLGRRPLLAVNQEIVNFIVHRKLENPRLSGDAPTGERWIHFCSFGGIHQSCMIFCLCSSSSG